MACHMILGILVSDLAAGYPIGFMIFYKFS